MAVYRGKQHTVHLAAPNTANDEPVGERSLQRFRRTGENAYLTALPEGLLRLRERASRI